MKGGTVADLWWYPIGFVAALLGYVQLHNARSGRQKAGSLFWAGGAAYLAFRNFWLFEYADTDRLIWFALIFCAASPVLGYLWWGRDGEIRRRFFRMLLFLALLTVGFVGWSFVVESPLAVLVLALSTAVLPFLPARKFRGWLTRRRLVARGRDEQRQAHQLSEAEHRQQEIELAQSHQAQAATQRQLTTKEKQVAALKRKDAQRRQKKELRRQEISGQIQQLREAEVEQVQRGKPDLRFHADYGFLIAEAWRVLRAQIARGDRVPAVEHDAFFFQVVEELLAAEDFEGRYFHAKGRKAITTANRYLAGRVPLRKAVRQIQRLRLTPAQLAPEPLQHGVGAELLEVWLVPHRRLQAAQWEEFQDGNHTYHVQIMTVWTRRGKGSGQPNRQQWQDLWDEQPALFLKPVTTSTAQSRQKASPWRKVVSSISQRVKAR